MCELKKEIGEKIYIEFLRKEMYKILKNKYPLAEEIIFKNEESV